MITDLKNKKVVITGGNKGIGKAISVAFAKAGAKVLFTYHSGEDEAKTTLAEIEKLGIQAKAVQTNVALAQDREKLVQESERFFGHIDILVNNAGIATRNHFLELTPEEVHKVMEVNFFAPFFLSQLVAKSMIQAQEQALSAKKPLQDLSIINISSISSRLPVKGLTHYEASKAALTQFTKSLSVTLASHQIRVNEVAPGYVPTDINRRVREQTPDIWQQRLNETPLKRAGETEEIAHAVLFLAQNAWITGTTITADGGRMCNWFGGSV